jgi:hypothetical protein
MKLLNSMNKSLYNFLNIGVKKLTGKKNNKVFINVGIVILLIIGLCVSLHCISNFYGQEHLTMQVDQLSDFNVQNVDVSETNNLITNGSFTGGIGITSDDSSIPDTFTTYAYGSSIISHNSPDMVTDGYVIEQAYDATTSTSNTNYKFRVSLKTGKTYILSCWETSTVDWDNKNLFHIGESASDNIEYTSKTNNQIMLEDSDGNKKLWKLKSVIFNIDATNTNTLQDIYIKLSNRNNTASYTGTRLIANLYLREILIDEPKFLFTNKLLSYVSSMNNKSLNSSHGTYWNDLSYNNNNFEFLNNPSQNPPLNILNNTITGIKSNELYFIDEDTEVTDQNTTNFSILMHLKLNTMTDNTTNNDFMDLLELHGEIPAVGEISGSISSTGSATIPKSLLTVQLNPITKAMNIIVDSDDNSITATKLNLIDGVRNLLSITYSKDTSKIKVWNNGTLVKTISMTNGFETSDDKMVINKDKNINADLYNVLVYNRDLGGPELLNINSYLNTRYFSNEHTHPNDHVHPEEDEEEDEEETTTTNQLPTTIGGQPLNINIYNNQTDNEGMKGNKSTPNKQNLVPDIFPHITDTGLGSGSDSNHNQWLEEIDNLRDEVRRVSYLQERQHQVSQHDDIKAYNDYNNKKHMERNGWSDNGFSYIDPALWKGNFHRQPLNCLVDSKDKAETCPVVLNAKTNYNLFKNV